MQTGIFLNLLDKELLNSPLRNRSNRRGTRHPQVKQQTSILLGPPYKEERHFEVGADFALCIEEGLSRFEQTCVLQRPEV